MLDAPARLAARPVLRVERRLAAPFGAIGRVETRGGALATAATLTLVSIGAALVAVFTLADLLALGTAARVLAIVAVIAWVVAVDVVEPLGMRLHDLVGTLTGELDTYRPLAAARLSVVRAALFVAAVVASGVAAGWVASIALAATFGLFAVSFLASQAESVARRRAWQLGDGVADPGSGHHGLGRDEELVHAVTSGRSDEPDAARRR